MGEYTNQIAILPEGTAGDLTDGLESLAPREPWQAPVMIRSTLADTDVAGSGSVDGPTLS